MRDLIESETIRKSFIYELLDALVDFDNRVTTTGEEELVHRLTEELKDSIDIIEPFN